MIFLLIFALAITASAQPFTLNDPAINGMGAQLGVNSGMGETNGVSFSPTNVAGMGLWLTASRAYTDAGSTLAASNGDPVRQLSDQSGLSRHLVQDTSSLRPYWTNNVSVWNGKPWIQFAYTGTGNGVTNWLTNSTGFTFAQPYTVFMTLKPIDAVATAYYFSATNLSTANRNRFTRGSGYSFGIYGGTTTLQTPAYPNSAAWEAPCLFELCYTNGGSSITTNGSLCVSGNVGTGAPSGMVLGSSYDQTTAWANMQFVELLVYTNLLSANDLYQLRNFYRTNYSLPMTNYGL